MKPDRTVARRPLGDRVRTALLRLGVVAVALGLTLTATGCGSGGSESGSSDAVTITHTMGEAVIEGTPQRVVTIGTQWLDAAVALGITPVGYLVPGGAANVTVPWLPDTLKQQSKALTAGGDLVEQIAALNPDLIVAPGFMMDKAMYDKLSKLAPTIGPLTSAQVDPWEDQMATLGKALRKRAEADKVVADVHGKIDAAAARHPGLRGKTFLTCMLTTPSQLMVLADPKDGSARLFTRMGMTMPEQLVRQAPSGGRLALSPERLTDLTADLLVCAAAPGLDAKFKQLPGYAELPSVRQGGIAFVDMITINAINLPTALSLPYVLDKLEPTLANVGK
ncbi:ABC transporter substrate-binding protein [Nocardia sp. CDC159]|uniref:ABC transporter substrate-binding protein n=1 Tax=Nocardia pulmonis TaxID=2951408 RepID=A0A9X2EAZ0_9NOCA|nr:MULTISPECIES: ABC transporter substrate-binding protein [Nocardia]MCM6776028.1 ABC transporter substrate-binding protein [Nocardia pulmonis]MCM6788645.1 ABC transporter substrate-binding protein [Nocardia sp. CDC159]